MSIRRISRKTFINSCSLFCIRTILGLILILAAVGKLPDQAGFIKTVLLWGFLPYKLAYMSGSVIPWLELVAGICLLMGFLSRIAAVSSIFMFLGFIAFNSTFYLHPESVYTCPCFGRLLYLSIPNALLMDALMVVAAHLTLIFGCGSWSISALIQKILSKPYPVSHIVNYLG